MACYDWRLLLRDRTKSTMINICISTVTSAIYNLLFIPIKKSTLKKCPHMLRSDHRGLRNRDLKLIWVVGVQGKGRNSFSSAATAYCLLLSWALVKNIVIYKYFYFIHSRDQGIRPCSNQCCQYCNGNK